MGNAVTSSGVVVEIVVDGVAVGASVIVTGDVWVLVVVSVE